ncbi:S9 family peptidase [Flavobacterium cyclinae]|uniref:S9 family peptidase n=1 Tax=Flavobacterium cyclinae TaxID=2895947 RepID=UPI001E64FF53|nr:prolyl oligopeptidase family serine peptidase [Flavobacterium cyclinae]UGS22350.1 prolyl oligopeptidase family serine peptidase [Flavobacterium cyclinae]
MRYFILLFFMLITTVFSQHKKQLTETDYSLWSKFNQTLMSLDGRWVSYGLEYEKADTLFLKNTTFKKSFCFPKANWATFSSKSDWFSYYKKDSLYLFDLKQERKLFIDKMIVDYLYSGDGSYLLVFKKEEATINLRILNLKNQSSVFIHDIVSYKVSPDAKRIALVTKEGSSQSVKVVALKSTLAEVIVVKDSSYLYSFLTWDVSGTRLAFFKFERNLSNDLKKPVAICWSTGFDKKVNKFTLEASETLLPKGYDLTTINLYLPEQSDAVLFTLQQPLENLAAVSNQEVQIWKSGDLTIPPKSNNDAYYRSLKWYKWDILANRVYSVEDSAHPNSILTGDTKHALVYHPDELAPIYKCSNELVALYVKNIATGEKDLLSDRQTTLENQVLISPTGKYITYFKDKAWWIYDIYKKTHLCLTCNLSYPVHQITYDRAGQFPPTYRTSWTMDGSKVIIHDQYDVWFIAPNGTSKKRLTNGAVTKTIYRVYEPYSPASPNYYSFGFLSIVHDLKRPLLLQTVDEETFAQGFVLLYPNGVIKTLFKRESKFHLVSTTKDFTSFLFLEQNFILPPRLFVVNSDGSEQLIHQSNTQQETFEWGKSRLVTYTNSKEKPLKGALFYPENYDAEKKYPLLVVIYEKKSKEVFDYSYPTVLSDWGFTISNYVSSGYFVLLPDIAYGLNSPGDDALDCVSAAVNSVVQQYPIASDAIALLGHSFGGYETAYIMGKSKLFKTAIIGAPLIDLLDHYLTIDGHGKSNMWRFEHDQMRMPIPFYSNEFERNSPLKNVQHISSPILTWTGSGDLQLDWKNGMKLHNALWRLDKKSTLLLYPDEGHVLADKKNQEDLSNKVKDWLDYYLKGKSKASWME